MNALFQLVGDEVLLSGGLALLHSFWQSAVVALIVLLLLRLLRRATAQSRYVVASVGLLASFILPVITFLRISENSAQNSIMESPAENYPNVAYQLAGATATGDGLAEMLTAWAEKLAPLMFWFWLAGLVVMAVRLTGGYYLAFRFRSRGVAPAEVIWQQRLSALASKMRVRIGVRLLESWKIQVPMVVGLLRPCIIVPVGTLSRLPFDQVEMILAHELAHIKRADFLVNFLQSLIETILFFNPFVWWISGVIRAERENICDDMALRTTGGYLPLAKALANLSAALQPAYIQDSLITFNQLNTMKRIQRLISNPKLKPSRTERVSVLVFAFLFVLFITASGVLTGSTTGESNTIQLNTLKPSPQGEDTLVQQKKTIEVEKKDGKIVSMRIDGKEVPPEELNKEGFEWKDASGNPSNVMIINGKDGKSTIVMDTDVNIATDENGKKVVKKVIRRGSPDGDNATAEKFVFISDDEAPLRMESDRIIIEGDSIITDGKKAKIIIHKSPGGNAYFINDDNEAFNFDIEMDEAMGDVLKERSLRAIEVETEMMEAHKAEMHRHAEEVRHQADMLRAEAEKLAATDAMAAAKMKEEAEAMERESEKMHQQAEKHLVIAMPRLPEAPPVPDMPEWTGEPHFVFKDADPDRPYHKLLRNELINEGVVSPRSNIILSKKQLIIDDQVADKQTHRQVLKRFEDILGRRIGAQEVITVKK